LTDSWCAYPNGVYPEAESTGFETEPQPSIYINGRFRPKADIAAMTGESRYARAASVALLRVRRR
jgi:hypothetical protein